MDYKNFKKFIDIKADDTIKSLCDTFADECPVINDENFKKKIAERFKEIICNAATTKRKRKKTTELVPQSQETTVLATISPSIKEQYGGELFGWSWAKKAAREKQIATENGVIEES